MADSASTELHRSCDKRQLHSCLYRIVRSQCGQCAGQNETQRYWVALRHSRNCRTLTESQGGTCHAASTHCHIHKHLVEVRVPHDCKNQRASKKSRCAEKAPAQKTSCGPTCDHYRIWYNRSRNEQSVSSSPKQGLTFCCPNK